GPATADCPARRAARDRGARRRGVAAERRRGRPGCGRVLSPALTGLRGDHPGSFEAAHALRDGTLALPSIAPASEAYDLVVVGGGISGLATAVFYRDARPDARILILDNHDDFGGH